MSLKAFHIVFIIASFLLAMFFGAWSLNAFFKGGTVIDLAMGVGSLAVGIALVFYGKAILKKLKHISYL